MKRGSGIYRYLVFFYRLFAEFGIDLIKLKRGCCGLVPFLLDVLRFWKERGDERFLFSQGTIYPCLGDRYGPSGVAQGAYFHQDLYVARQIFKRNPERHVDVGSRVDGFIAHVASFREIEVVDIRDLPALSDNIKFRKADMMAELEQCYQAYCDSLSCLHALEHFGLGRYGDPVCRDGFLRGWDNLYRMLKPGGILYFSVPLGPGRVEFNAHRVFSVDQLRRLIGDVYEVVCFSYIDDDGEFFENVDINGSNNNFGCCFGCAVFELRKK